MKKHPEKKLDRAGVCVVSYPKGGRTWLRVLIAKALCDQYGLDERAIFDKANVTEAPGLPAIWYTHDDASSSEAKHYRDLETDKARYREKSVILLIRDPRDVVVSYYFEATKRRGLFRGSISEFVGNDLFGIRKIVTFYNIWHANLHVPAATLVLRYEEMQADPAGKLRSALEFIGARVDDAIIENAVLFARFDNMKTMEKNGRFESKKLEPRAAGDEESYKVRRGMVGGYVDYLAPEDSQFVNRVMRELGCPFYPTAQ